MGRDRKGRVRDGLELAMRRKWGEYRHGMEGEAEEDPA